MYIDVLVWIYVHHVCAGVLRSQKRVPGPLELKVRAVVGHLTWVLVPKPGPLEEECALLTYKPSLSPNVTNFNKRQLIKLSSQCQTSSP